MDKKHFYLAFGLTIESFWPINQIPSAKESEADVRIVRAEGFYDDPELLLHDVVTAEHVMFRVDDLAAFRISSGNLIEVDLPKPKPDRDIGIYLMGSCMGAILVQRGFMLLHGSCVTDGNRSVLITGDSGAGKSTLAAEFLKKGWKLLTDDVTCVFDQEGIPMVQSSYPSQKLWQDALDRYEKSGDDIHSLYFSEDREKFGVNVADSFFDGTAPLSMAVRLIPADHLTTLNPIEGMAKVDQLMRNTYRMYFIEKHHMQRHFQRCVTLATKIPMALAVRENGKDCAPVLYDMITKFMEEHCHD